MGHRSVWWLGLGIVAAGLAVRSIWSRRQAVSVVPPEMRTPLLYLRIDLRSRRALRVIRTIPVRPAPVVEGVGLTERAVPAGHGSPDVPLFVYDGRDRQRPSGALLWIHGGGYVGGDPVIDHTVCSQYARDLGVLVVSPRYRLAPEHPFPAGLDDCYAALRWLHDRADELGVDRTRIAVGGESAGGGLAAALAQLAYDRGEVPVCFQLLVYPMLDDRTALDRARAQTLVWTPEANVFGWTSYLGHPPRDREDRPYAVPSRREDLSGLPPAWVGVGDIDLFHGEDVAYAERLRAAGVACQLEMVPSMYHGAFSLAPLTSSTVKAFRTSATAALRTALKPAAETSVSER